MSETTTLKTVRVSRDQVSAARALIRLRGERTRSTASSAKVASARPGKTAKHTKAS